MWNMGTTDPHTLTRVRAEAYREVGVGFGTTWPRTVMNELPAWMPPIIRIDPIFCSRHFRAVEATVGPYLGSAHLPMYGSLALSP